jgi:hypothetical protein
MSHVRWSKTLEFRIGNESPGVAPDILGRPQHAEYECLEHWEQFGDVCDFFGVSRRLVTNCTDDLHLPVRVVLVLIVPSKRICFAQGCMTRRECLV